MVNSACTKTAENCPLSVLFVCLSCHVYKVINYTDEKIATLIIPLS